MKNIKPKSLIISACVAIVVFSFYEFFVIISNIRF